MGKSSVSESNNATDGLRNVFLKGVVSVIAIAGIFTSLGALQMVVTAQASTGTIDVWWPTNGSALSGVQPFRAMLEGADVSSYNMFWEVDGGTYNAMPTNNASYPHKEASVDVSSWNWQPSGNYDVTFIAQNLQGGEIARTSVEVQVANPSGGATASPSQPQQQSSQPSSQSQPSANSASSAITVGAPANGADVSGATTFAASLTNTDPADYYMFWEVGNGVYNQMSTNGNGKSVTVDLSAWNWEPSGDYTITFIAQNLQGGEIARTSVNIHVGGGGSAPVAAPAVSVPASPALSVGIGGVNLYVDPASDAAQAAASIKSSDPSDASLLQMIANQPTGEWFGNWNTNVQNDVNAAVTAAAADGGSEPVLVAYNIPDRDCGGYSSGGATNASQYASWIRSFAAGIGGRRAIVILEPDATSDTSCLSSSDASARWSMLSDAVNVLKSAGATVYLDAGHADWVDPTTMAANLRASGIANADGFALNVSNFYSTSDNEQYGDAVSAQVGGKHFVIDTGRNGAGSQGAQWCNPQGAALGAAPTTNTGSSPVDAFLWVKPPGESDGACNGGPSAGTFWPGYAEQLARNAGW